MKYYKKNINKKISFQLKLKYNNIKRKYKVEKILNSIIYG